MLIIIWIGINVSFLNDRVLVKLTTSVYHRFPRSKYLYKHWLCFFWASYRRPKCAYCGTLNIYIWCGVFISQCISDSYPWYWVLCTLAGTEEAFSTGDFRLAIPICGSVGMRNIKFHSEYMDHWFVLNSMPHGRKLCSVNMGIIAQGLHITVGR